MCITHGEKKHYKDRKSLKRQYLFHLPVKKASRSSSDLHTKKGGRNRNCYRIKLPRPRDEKWTSIHALHQVCKQKK